MKNEQNARFLRDICMKNTFFAEFWGHFPALKLSVSRLNPNTSYVIMVGHRSMGAIMLYLFMRLLTLLYTLY